MHNELLDESLAVSSTGSSADPIAIQNSNQFNNSTMVRESTYYNSLADGSEPNYHQIMSQNGIKSKDVLGKFHDLIEKITGTNLNNQSDGNILSFLHTKVNLGSVSKV